MNPTLRLLPLLLLLGLHACQERPVEAPAQENDAGMDSGDCRAQQEPDAQAELEATVEPPDAARDIAGPDEKDQGLPRDAEGADALLDAGPIPWPPRIDPRLFDCRSLDIPLPERRRSTAPLSCIVDPGCSERMVVGHRGLGGNLGYLAPENSLAAIRGAIVAGLDGVEVDVRLSADGVLVLVHDETVDRTMQGSGKVEELTLEELRAMTFEVKEGELGLVGDFSCERIPTFAEALELSGGRLFLDVDTKTDRADLVALAIEEAGALDRAFVSASSMDKLSMARDAVPRVRIQVRPDDPDEVGLFLEHFDPDPDIFEMDDGDAQAVAELIHALGLKVFIDAFYRDAGAIVAQDFTGYEELWGQGADVLQTEFPLVLLLSMERL